MAENNTFFYVIIGIILIILVAKPSGLYSFFFTQLPVISVAPSTINQGDTSSLSISGVSFIQIPNAAGYIYGAFINQKLICSGTVGALTTPEFSTQCLIGSVLYSNGANNIEVYHGFYVLSSGQQSRGLPAMLMNYNGAVAYDNYINSRDGGKLFNQCLYGTPNGESYDSSDPRWYVYPTNSQWTLLGGSQPPDSGGGNCEVPGARCRQCLNQLSRLDSYEKKNLNLQVISKTGGCTLQSNQLIAVQDFNAGSTISKSTLRYPVVNFCNIYPPLVVDSNTLTTYNDYDILNNLNNNKSYIVPSGKAIAVFYIINNDPSIPVLCSPDKIYDIQSGLCKNAIGIITICQTGTFDPSKGLCVTQANVTAVCPIGARFDISLNLCIYNPPVRYVCDIGTYNSTTNKCEYHPGTDIICSQGIYNSLTGKCEYTPPVAAVCNIGIYNSLTGKCEYVPSSSAVCSIGIYNPTTAICEYNPPIFNLCLQGTYNSLTGKCEVQPSTSIKCLQGIYDSSTNTCIYTPSNLVQCTSGTYNQALNACIYQPSLQAQCPQGTAYNSIINKCEYTPPTSAVCPQGTAYNSIINKCEYTPPVAAVCNIGIYNSLTGKCETTASTNIICTTGTYNSNTGRCEINPQVQTICLQGTYDASLNGCKIIPNIAYLCLDGNLTKDSTGNYVCTIYPQQKIICLESFNYNSITKQCERIISNGTTINQGTSANQGISTQGFDFNQLLSPPYIYIVILVILFILWRIFF